MQFSANIFILCGESATPTSAGSEPATDTQTELNRILNLPLRLCVTKKEGQNIEKARHAAFLWYVWLCVKRLALLIFLIQAHQKDALPLF